MKANEFDNIYIHEIPLDVDPDECLQNLELTSTVAESDCYEGSRNGFFLVYVILPNLVGTEEGIVY